MNTTEFAYRLPGTPGGGRPGAHRSHSLGPGLNFARHLRLFDQPDPRRIDLRASVKNLHGEWLVKATHQRSAVVIQAIVDVSASMRFGVESSKLSVAADFVESLGYSAFRYGDAVSLLGFDARLREDLWEPARTGRGAGMAMAKKLRDVDTHEAQGRALAPADASHVMSDCLQSVSRGSRLVFLLSDFHGLLDAVEATLDQWAPALLVPIVIWDRAETTPPLRGQWLQTRDAESAATHSLLLRESSRQRWRNGVQQRREQLVALFGKHDIYPCFMEDGFDAELLSRHFMDTVL